MGGAEPRSATTTGTAAVTGLVTSVRRWLADDDETSAMTTVPWLHGWREAWRDRQQLVDGLLAAAVALFCVPQLIYWSGQSAGGFILRLTLTVLMVVPLVWRRRFPLATFGFASGVAVVQWLLGVTLAADVTLLVLLFTVASRYRLRVAVTAAAVLEVGVVLAMFRWRLDTYLDLPWVLALLLLSGPVAVALLFGVSVRARRRTTSALVDRARQLARDRDQQAALAVAAERARIARELHDVVAHSLSVMVTLADAATLKAVREPERAAVAMSQVSATGHQALQEMRGLLGVLRSEDDPEGRHPLPGVGQLDDLVQRVRNAGLAVDLTVTGPLDSVSPGVGLTVFRVVQECLTNTLKHAVSPSRVVVDVVAQPDQVLIHLQDDGRAARGRAEDGFGLAGMRERVTAYGGTLQAGTSLEGGWSVDVRLPLGPSSRADGLRPGAVR